MIEVYRLIIMLLCAFIASSGFWMYLQKRTEKNCAQMAMLRGLGHDRIMYQGLQYIKQGYITTSEYDNIKNYLYMPYKQLGGNGSADRIMCEVDKLELRE